MATFLIRESKTLFENKAKIDNPARIRGGTGKLEQLVICPLQGDQQAFSEIIDQYSTLMLCIASMIVSDRDITGDVVRDAFIQTWLFEGNICFHCLKLFSIKPVYSIRTMVNLIRNAP